MKHTSLRTWNQSLLRSQLHSHGSVVCQHTHFLSCHTFFYTRKSTTTSLREKISTGRNGRRFTWEYLQFLLKRQVDMLISRTIIYNLGAPDRTVYLHLEGSHGGIYFLWAIYLLCLCHFEKLLNNNSYGANNSWRIFVEPWNMIQTATKRVLEQTHVLQIPGERCLSVSKLASVFQDLNLSCLF